MAKISLIAAMSLERVIGVKNQLPWHLPDDLRRFKQLTLGKPVVMGSQTYLSIGKPLPGRENFVLTRDVDKHFEGCFMVHDVGSLVEAVKAFEEIFIIGGAQIYQQFLPIADRLYLTVVQTSVAGDAYFPEWNPSEWQEYSREHHPIDEKHPVAFDFVVLDRRVV